MTKRHFLSLLALLGCDETTIEPMKASKIFASFISAPSWIPSSIANLLIWYRGTSATQASDGSSWTDTMGNYNLTGGATKPTKVYALNRRTGFKFITGSGATMTGPHVSEIEGIPKMTVFGAGYDSVFTHEVTGGTRNMLCYIPYVNTYYVGVNGTTSYGNLSPAPSGWYYYIFVYDGTQAAASRYRLWLNGVEQAIGVVGSNPPTVTPSNPSTVLKLGQISGTLAPGVSLEHGIYTKALDAAEISLLNSYLATNYGDGPHNVYFYGDSITAGTVGGVASQNRWVNVLCGYRGWTGTNNGLVGAPLESASPVFSGNMYDQRSTIPTKGTNDRYLVFSYGVNDCGYNYNSGSYNTTTFKTQYQAILDVAFSKGWSASTIVMQTGFYQNAWSDYVPANADTPADATRWLAFINATKEVAQDNGILCIDQTGQYGASETTDNRHPNTAGHLAIANYMTTLIP